MKTSPFRTSPAACRRLVQSFFNPAKRQIMAHEHHWFPGKRDEALTMAQVWCEAIRARGARRGWPDAAPDAKTAGAGAILARVKGGEREMTAVPALVKDLPSVGATGRSVNHITLPEGSSGLTAYYPVRHVNAKGEAGPWSGIVSRVIP
jgi:hypothetical protein